MNKKLLVIIITYNAMKWIDRCFASLRQSSVKSSVFVVDNGSTDGTQAYLLEKYPEVIFTQSQENLGFGRANNIGLRYAIDKNYDYVYLLNQDAWVMPDTFEKLISIMSLNKQFGIVSPLQMNADMTKLDRNFNTLYLASKPTSVSGLVEVSTIMAAHWMLSISTIRKIGAFSTVFYHHTEDDNYVDRLHYHGLKCGVYEYAKAVHDREFRKDSLEKKADLEFKARILVISDPGDNLLRCLLTQPYRLLKSSTLYGVKRTITNTLKLIALYPKIIINRSVSKNEGAFL